MEDLEALFLKCAENEARLDLEYDELVQEGIVSVRSFAVKETCRPRQTKSVVRSAALISSKRTVHHTQEDLQVYMIRRRYMKLDSSFDMEPSADVSEPQSAWRDCPMVQRDKNELYLLVQTFLQGGRISEELQGAVQLQTNRQDDTDQFRQIFSTVWISLQQGTSKERMRQLMAQLPARVMGKDTKQHALCLMRSAIEYSLNVIEYAEQLKEQGYRNRQEALERALREAESRYEAAYRNVVNHRY